MFRSRISVSLLCVTLGSGGAAHADIQAGLDALNLQDYETAAAEFKSSLDAKDGDGGFYLGRMFELGLGTQPNLRQAITLYEASMELDSALGKNRMGLLYLEGNAVLRDYERGAELVCEAADQGNANGQFNCGIAYKNGQGVAQSDADAVKYWQAASDQGNIAASNMLGLALKTGEGIDVDAAKAVELFSTTAEKGNALGLFELALARATGEGIEADMTEAYKWANLAAARQHPDAPGLRDQIEAELTPEQVTAGQKAARLFLESLQNAQSPTTEPQSE